MNLARILNLIGAVVTQTGEAVAPNLPTLQPAARVHRRKVHAVARDMRAALGLPEAEGLGR